MDDSFSNLTLPVFLSQNFNEYKNEVELWSLITSLPREKQALAITYSLPNEVRKGVLEGLSVKKDLNNVAGLNILLRYLEKNLNSRKVAFLYKEFIENSTSQQPQESMEDYISRFCLHKEKAENLPEDHRWAFSLLSGANITQKEKEVLLESMDPEDVIMYSKVKNSLLNPHTTQELVLSRHSRKRRRLCSVVQGSSADDEESEVSLLQLPNELIKKIIFLLDTKDIVSLSGCNKRLHQSIADYRPWRELSPSLYSFRRLPSLLNHVSKCRDLRRLYLPGIRCPNDFNALYAQVAASCRRLEMLSVTVFDRHDLDFLAFLFDSCTLIKKLSMKSSELVLIDLRALKMIGNRLPHLAELDISDNFMDPTELTYISHKFRNLKLLVLQVYGNSDEESNVAIKQISERCTDLEVLKLKGFAMSSASLMSIGQNCKKLNTFLLNPDRDMLSSDLKEFGRLCSELEHLHLMIGDMDNSTFSAGTTDMLENMTKLQSFHLYEERRSLFPIQILDTLGDKCNKLKEISLFLYGDGNQISSALRSFLIQPVANQIEKMAIRYNCDTPVRALRELGKHSPNLKHLHLGKVSISELDFLYILRGCEKLESIILADLDTTNWSCDIGKFCLNLRSISSNCLNTISTCSILNNCSNLQRVDVLGDGIRGESLGDLGNLQFLEVLRISPVESVDEFAPLVVNCGRLKEIYTDYTDHERKILRTALDRSVLLLAREDMIPSCHPWTVDHLLAYGTSFGPFALPP